MAHAALARIPMSLLALVLALLTGASRGAVLRDTGGGECPTAPEAPSDRRLDKRALTLATFNAEWLFDGIDDPAPSPRNGDPTAARAHLKAVAAVLGEIDADVVNLVEVEGCGRPDR